MPRPAAALVPRLRPAPAPGLPVPDPQRRHHAVTCPRMAGWMDEGQRPAARVQTGEGRRRETPPRQARRAGQGSNDPHDARQRRGHSGKPGTCCRDSRVDALLASLYICSIPFLDRQRCEAIGLESLEPLVEAAQEKPLTWLTSC